MQHSVERVYLKNGAEGLFITVPSAAVTNFDIIFRAGDYLSPNNKTDTAHVMEHMVLGANKTYKTSREFSKEFSKFGAYNNAYTGDYHMGYEAECAASESDRINNLLCIAIESPLFMQDEFEAEIGNVTEELKMRRNNDNTELGLSLEHAMHFVPIPNRARIQQLKNITLQDIKDHYAKTHTTTNMRFVIAGPLTANLKNTIINRLENIQLAKGVGLIDLPAETPIALPKPLELTNSNLDNIVYRLEVVLPLYQNYLQRDSMGMVFDELFDGFHSKVFGKLRELGLAYGIFSADYDTKDNSVCIIYGQVQANNVMQLATILHDELKLVATKGISATTLNELKKRNLGGVQRSYQTVGSLVSWYRGPYTMLGEVFAFDEIDSRINNVTNQSMVESAMQLLQSNTYGFGVMKNPNDEVDALLLQQKIMQP